MFLLEVLSENLLFLLPESGALLICGVSLIGGAVVVRKFLKHQDTEKNSGDRKDEGEDRETT